MNLIYLFSTRTADRTDGCATFDDEKPQPSIGNLTTHTREKHSTEWNGDASTTLPSSNPIDHGYTPASAKLMASFLEEGKLNPKRDPTKKGFLKHFAAWILEEDLPFTTGESPGIRRLFEYMSIKFQLPSDTTVRNMLAKIYIELHGNIVKELSVRIRSLSRSYNLTYLESGTEREVEDILLD
jgi:hypothetical protein